jgi:hypothetical protein
MNKTMTYTNLMLTIIAALLCALAFESSTKSSGAGSTHVQDVNIVSVSKSLPVALDSAASRGVPLDVTVVGNSKVFVSNLSNQQAPIGPLDVRLIGSTISLPVLVANTNSLDVNIGIIPSSNPAAVRLNYLPVMVVNPQVDIISVNGISASDGLPVRLVR